MGLFGKIKEILFDEETVEIPVITKEEDQKEDIKSKEKTKKVKENSRVKKNEDEVIIKKIDTPKREVSKTDDLFDMPKFKEEVKEEKKANSFSFPVFDDNDEIGEIREPGSKRSSRSILDEAPEVTPKRSTVSEKSKEERNKGYNNAYDYSYGKYKGDYKTSRESKKAILAETLERKEEHTTFTPSPIISPVYGVLNENYKKEDIVTKTDYRNNNSVLDLDSVRRKAYGTLEDDIEDSLDKVPEYEDDSEINESDYYEDDDGISINDLLVTQDEDALDEINDQTSEIELFDVTDKVDKESTIDIDSSPQEEIELNDEALPITEEKAEEDINKITVDDDIIPAPKEKKVPKADSFKEEKVGRIEKEEDKSIKEEDLFDLIDSLYEGKDEE